MGLRSLWRGCLGSAVLSTLPLFPSIGAAQELQLPESPQAWDFWRLIDEVGVSANWLSDGSSFWYAGGDADSVVLYLVDPGEGTIRPLVDVARVRQALAERIGSQPSGRGLPFSSVEFTDASERTIQFSVGSSTFQLDLDSFQLRPLEGPEPVGSTSILETPAEGSASEPWWRAPIVSPDGTLRALNIEGNVVIEGTDGTDRWEVTQGGSEEWPWVVGDNGWWGVGWWQSSVVWSPDNRYLALRRVDYRDVSLVRDVDWLGSNQAVTSWPHAYSGEEMALNELWVADTDTRQLTRVQLETPAVNLHMVGWAGEGASLVYATSDRHEREVKMWITDLGTGDTRLVQTERSDTFVRHTEGPLGILLLAGGRRFIRSSERDGWRHLYLYSIDGTLVRRLTTGEYPVEGILQVDEDAGYIYYQAASDPSRPYDLHVHRVQIETGRDERLTDGAGSREYFQLSPSGEYFLVDNVGAGYMTVELWSVDGTFVRTIAEVSTDRLEAAGWTPPEEVIALASDDRTDLWGLLYKPLDFDPSRRYPIVLWVYGQGGSWVTPDLRTGMFAQALAGRDLVVVQLDVRGSPGRGKAFEDAFYGVGGRYEIADHVTVLRQLAEQRSYMDLDKVGIFGHSMGGYYSLRGMLLEPEFFSVGVSSAGPAEFSYAYYMRSMDEAPEEWAFASNLELIDRLEDPLLLLHGTSDGSVPLSETMEVISALTNAGKPYDLRLFPGETHGFMFSQASGPFRAAQQSYWQAVREYLVRHLRP